MVAWIPIPEVEFERDQEPLSVEGDAKLVDLLGVAATCGAQRLVV